MSLVYLCQIAVSAALHNIFYDPVWIWARSFLRWMTRIIEMSSSIPRWLNFSNTIKHSHWKYLTLNEEAVSQRLFVYRARPSCIDGDPTLKLNQVKHQRQVEDSSKNKSLVSRRRGLRGLDPSRRPPFFFSPPASSRTIAFTHRWSKRRLQVETFQVQNCRCHTTWHSKQHYNRQSCTKMCRLLYTQHPAVTSHASGPTTLLTTYALHGKLHSMSTLDISG